MTGKQITGVILLLVGLLVGFIGLMNVLDLISAQGNKMVALALQMQGMSMGGLWIKFGGMTVVGIVMLIIGIKFAKKNTPTEVPAEK